MLAKNIILTLDTETCDLSGGVYDIGWIIHTRSGEVLAERNWLVEEIFTDAKRMMGAFYAKKLFTHYAPMLAAQDIGFNSWENIVEQLRADIKDFQVQTLAAYNLGFDIRAIGNTHKELGFAGKVLESEIKLLDIWQFACETKLSSASYKQTALDNGWISPAGNIKTGAEFAYRFCISDHGFIEDHTALSDCVIEVEILRQCFASKKKIPYGKINKSPRRIVNPTATTDKHIHGSITK